MANDQLVTVLSSLDSPVIVEDIAGSGGGVNELGDALISQPFLYISQNATPGSVRIAQTTLRFGLKVPEGKQGTPWYPHMFFTNWWANSRAVPSPINVSPAMFFAIDSDSVAWSPQAALMAPTNVASPYTQLKTAVTGVVEPIGNDGTISDGVISGSTPYEWYCTAPNYAASAKGKGLRWNAQIWLHFHQWLSTYQMLETLVAIGAQFWS